jgi:hypothetical protein
MAAYYIGDEMTNRYRIPLRAIKVICRVAVVPALFYVVAGNWVVGLCLILGAWIFERNLYRCPRCRYKLDMRIPLNHLSSCPECHNLLL